MEIVQLKRRVGAVWGIAGITLIIGSAIIRVTPKALDAFRVGLHPLQWAVLVVWVTFMLIGEGYRGFQLKFSPRVAARMWHLLQHGRSVDLWLAPFYCIGYYGASKRRIISSWSLTVGVTLIILVVVQLPQPWRGIIDCGVVLGLLYGLICVYAFTWRTLRSRIYVTDPEVSAAGVSV
jgi:hypothetical protein